MAMRVLIIPDKFKGTLSAEDVARSLARGWKRARPQDEVELLPMTDGGDGFGAVLGRALKGRVRTVATVDAAGRPCRARWWWVEASRTAILETAQSNGLALLPRGKFHPFELDTRGVAALVLAARRSGARTCLAGVGGSATNDGGFGMARALGWRFLDAAGHELERWTELESLKALVPPARAGKGPRWIVATDVSNPLTGRRGASRIYGPQKGLREEDLASADRCLARLGSVVRRQLGVDPREPGSGAAGGLGFGLKAFLGADRQLGFEVFAKAVGLATRLRQVDLVITGEGAVDRSTAMGKGVGQIIQWAKLASRPVVVFAGRIQPGIWSGKHRGNVIASASLLDRAGEAEAMGRPAELLSEAAMELGLGIHG